MVELQWNGSHQAKRVKLNNTFINLLPDKANYLTKEIHLYKQHIRLINLKAER